MSSVMKTCTALACLGLLLAARPASAQPAEEDPPAVAKAKKLLEANKATIVFAAHPTSSLKEMTCLECRKEKDEFRLVYSYSVKGALGKVNTRLCFHFDAEGNILKCDCLNSSGLLPPFAAFDLVLQIGKEELKKFVKNNDNIPVKLREYLDNPLAQTVIDKVDTKVLLVQFLRYQENKE